jgi:hypothetical protein
LSSDLLTPGQVASRLNVCYKTVIKELNNPASGLKGIRIGRGNRWRITEENYQQYLKSGNGVLGGKGSWRGNGS